MQNKSTKKGKPLPEKCKIKKQVNEERVNRYLRNAKLRSKSMERGRTVTLKLQNQEASQ